MRTKEDYLYLFARVSSPACILEMWNIPSNANVKHNYSTKCIGWRRMTRNTHMIKVINPTESCIQCIGCGSTFKDSDEP